MSDDPLLQPYQLKHLRLKNRLMITSHEPAYAEDGMPKDRYRAYHVERAQGGVALTMTAGSAVVSRDSPPAFNNVLAYRDDVVGWLRKLADAVHDHDCAVMIQLTHLGRRTRWDAGDWLPSIAPGYDREPAHRASPKLMEGWDIDRIVTDYADAAERMRDAGLDGIELESYGHLMDGFWSPRLNDLDDPWNGSLQNRMRFSDRVLAAVRDRVGPDFIVGIRFVADEDVEGGITREEGIEIARRLRDGGQVDFLNVIRGRIDTDAALTGVIPVQGMASAPHLDFAGDIRARTGIPTFHAAKIQDVATARHAVATGKLDMVGMTRAHIAEPHIVAKIKRGEEHRIRPCVGANYCLDRIYMGGSALCLHNAATGRELTEPHLIARAEAVRRIVIVGAGPAGLEAARVCGERGHDVVVFEAADDPGGQVRLTAQTQRRRDMMGIVDWRMAECTRSGVSFQFNTLADAETVQAEGPDVVLIATGGLPHLELPTGGDLCASAWDILSGDVPPGRDVLIGDVAGDYAGLQAAEKIAQSGARVELVTRDRNIAPEVMSMSLTPAIRELQRHNVTLTPFWHILAVEQDGNRLRATLGSDFGAEQQTRTIDQVVMNDGTRPLDDLYFALRDGATNGGAVDHDALIVGAPQTITINRNGTHQLFRIGDAVSARNVHAAVYDALRLCKVL